MKSDIMNKYDKERAQIRAKVWLTPRVMRRALASVDRRERKAALKASS